MTALTRRIKHRTVETYANRHRRQLVVLLIPGDVIGIREERCRNLFAAPIDRVDRQIVARNVDAERQQRATAGAPAGSRAGAD